MENLNERKDTNGAWENVEENIKTSFEGSQGLYELKQHKPCCDELCSGLLDQRKQAKMQWLQDPNKSNVDNLNNVKREASRHFWNRRRNV